MTSPRNIFNLLDQAIVSLRDKVRWLIGLLEGKKEAANEREKQPNLDFEKPVTQAETPENKA